MKKHVLLSLLVLNIFLGIQNRAYGQNIENAATIHDSIQFQTDQVFDKLVQIRRDLHQHPELSGEEYKTQEFIKNHLLDLGLQVETDTYGYGVIGILEGKENGKNIAWRADTDALPDDSPDVVDFCSATKGVKHSCGHDVHTTIGLGIAEIMAKHKDSLQGTIYFIFQPQEETFEGAKGMLDDGLLSKFKIDEIYGLHVTPASVGQIIVKPNEMYAYQEGVKLELKNTLSDDEVKSLATTIQNSLFKTANGKPIEMQLLVDPEIGLTNPNTIFKDYSITGEAPATYSIDDKLYIEVRLYETDSARLSDITTTIKQAISDKNYSSELLSISLLNGNPIVINDPKLTNGAIDILNNIYGAGYITRSYGQVPYSNDDFAYFQQQIPGVYFFLGASNFEKGIIAMMHASIFGVDEECIRMGVKSFSSLLFERLK